MSSQERYSRESEPNVRPDFSKIDDATRKKIELTPEAAQARLAHLFLHYDEETIKELHDNFRAGTSGSHEVRALLRIAEGSEPRLLGEVYWDLREEDGLV